MHSRLRTSTKVLFRKYTHNTKTNKETNKYMYINIGIYNHISIDMLEYDFKKYKRRMHLKETKRTKRTQYQKTSTKDCALNIENS